MRNFGVNFEGGQKRQPALTGTAPSPRSHGGLQYCSVQLVPRNENPVVSLSRVCEELSHDLSI